MIEEGVPRASIKAIIPQLGGETISDLDIEGLITLHNKIKEI